MKERKHFSKIGWIYLAGTLLIFLTQAVGTRIILAVNGDLLANQDLMIFVTSICSYGISMPCVVWAMKRFVEKPQRKLPEMKAGVAMEEKGEAENVEAQPEALETEVVESSAAEVAAPRKMSAGHLFIAFVMSYTLVYISNFLGLFVTDIIGNIKGSPVQNPMEGVVQFLSPWMAILVMVIMAPIAEEILFRKILIDRIKGYGEGVAITISALMFAAMHGNLNQFAYAFSLGLFFGFIYVKTRNIRYTMILHAGINFMGSVPSLLLMKTEAFAQMEQFSGSVADAGKLLAEHGQTIVLIYGYLMLVGILIIAGLILWLFSIGKMRCKLGILKDMGLRFGGKIRITILNLGMLGYLIFWLIMMGTQAMG